MPETLASRVRAATSAPTGVTFVGSQSPIRLSWTQMFDEARASASFLQQRGVGPGDHVALLGPTSRELVTAIEATVLLGATLVVLPLPMRLGSLEEFVTQTRARVRGSDASIVVVDPSLSSFIEPAPGDPPIVGLDAITLAGAAGADSFSEPKDDPGALAILQFTSGSTSDPKGVMLPHAQVLANIDGLCSAAHLVPDDVLVSWLPLYHDMGLIGILLLSMTTGTEVVLGAPQDFLAAPLRWMQWMSEHRGTVTAGPNFSYALATRALRRSASLDLSAWRLALNGAEPVDPASVEAFCDVAALHGFDPTAMFPAFGMAEATLGVTFPEPGLGLVTDTVDRAVLENERYAAPVNEHPGARRLALLGRAIPGLEIRVVDTETGDAMRDREVGELEVRGTSVTPGYYQRPDATAAVFHDGWLRTGDLAYLVDGQLVVCGRLKDVIIVGGRNIFPEDVERAVAEVDGVRAGNVIAFGIAGRRGREAMVVVAETRVDEPASLRAAVAEAVRDSIGLHAEEVVLVEPGSLPKTSSGKLQRSLCRARYLDSQLQLVST